MSITVDLPKTATTREMEKVVVSRAKDCQAFGKYTICTVTDSETQQQKMLNERRNDSELITRSKFL